MNTSSSLSFLARGHAFPSASLTLTRAEVDAYLDAVGHDVVPAISRACVPPVATAAFALRELLAVFDLPGGSVHTSEEVDWVRPARIDELLRCESTVVQASDRQGYRFATIEQRLVDTTGQAIMIARSSIMSPLENDGV